MQVKIPEPKNNEQEEHTEDLMDSPPEPKDVKPSSTETFETAFCGIE